MERSLITWIFAWASPFVFGQGWTPVHTIIDPAPTGTGPSFATTIDLMDQRIAVGDPNGGSGDGVVHLFGRNSGGIAQWELETQINAPAGAGPDFATSVKLRGEDVFIAGRRGLWRYGLLPTGPLLVGQLDTGNIRSISIQDQLLIASNLLLPGSYSTVIKAYTPDEDGPGGYRLRSGIGIGDPPLIYSACPGDVITMDRGSIVIADHCYLSGPFEPVSGKVVFYEWNDDAGELQTGLGPSAWTPHFFWPQGEGHYSGWEFGRAMAMRGDTLFIGWGITPAIPFSQVDVFIREEDEWMPTEIVLPPLGATGEPEGDIGTALAVKDNELFVGTSVGLAFYRERSNGPGWEFIGQDSLGGAVTGIAVDGDLLAAAVPVMDQAGEPGRVVLYERVGTGMNEAHAGSPMVLRCSPNPAFGQVTVGPLAEGLASVALGLSDAMGRMIRSIPWDGSAPLPVDVRDIPDQVVLLRATDRLGRLVGVARLVTASDRR